MPLVDMPLEQLLKYEGTSPCPSDFDEFWDKSLLEMKAIDPKVELVPSWFQTPYAECFDLYFTGVKGARIHAKYLRPRKSTGQHPAIVQFHGYSGNAGGWNEKLSYVALGFSFAGLDCRGQGGYSEDVGGVSGNTFRGHIVRGLEGPPEDMLMRNIFLDTAQLAGIVMSFEEVDENRVGATGGSQGGGLTLACASLEPRIKRLAYLYPFLTDYKRVWDMDLAIAAYDELKGHFRFYDPKHLREAEIFNKLGYIDVQNLTKRIRGEALMGTGLSDTVCPPSTQFAAYNKITSKKDVRIYPDFGHEGLPEFDDEIFQFLSKL